VPPVLQQMSDCLTVWLTSGFAAAHTLASGELPDRVEMTKWRTGAPRMGGMVSPEEVE